MFRAEPQTVRLDEDALDALDRRLTIARAKLAPGVKRDTRGRTARADDANLTRIHTDIIKTQQKGVRIAPQTQSRPLIPLFKVAKTDLPPEIQVDHDLMSYDFYCVEVIFGTALPSSQFPLKGELRLVLDDDVPDNARRTRPIKLFPGRRDLTLFRADVEAAVVLDGAMDLTVPVAGPSPLPFATVNADARLKAGLVMGPLSFAIRKAEVEVTGEGAQDILWRYNFQSEITGAHDFKSILILKVAQEAQHVEMNAAIDIVPCKRSWLVFKDVLPKISHQIVLPVELAG